MDVSTVGSTTTTSSYAPPAQPQRNEQVQATKSAEAKPEDKESVQKAAAEQPKPVVNMNGQKTGSIVNTSA